MRILGHNHNIKNFIVSKIWLVKVINFYFNLKNRKRFIGEVERRASLSIFDYKDLVKPLPYAPSEIVIDNNLYGIAYWLNKYAGLTNNKYIDAYIEHGVYFGNLVRDDQKRIPVKSVITYSSVREQHLKASNINKEIIKIGPYIHYVDGLLSESEKHKLKKILGKVLLVFPSHSIIGVDAKFDEESFYKEIDKIKRNFDTVLISLYWTDVLNTDIVKAYEKKGYKIVTSGHRFDLNFLSRQKSLIEISDYTMSNSVGTHVGYCFYLKKPHYLFKQKVKNIGKTEKLQKHFNMVRNAEELSTEELEKKEVGSLFSVFDINTKITKEKIEVIDKYWGIRHIKDREQLRKILVR